MNARARYTLITVVLIKIFVTLILFFLFSFWVLVAVFGGITSSRIPSGIFLQTLFWWFPVAALLTIILMWVKKWSVWVWVPPLVLVVWASMQFYVTVISFVDITKADREGDTTMITYDLDGVATLAVPKSFEQDTSTLISGNYYYAELGSGSYTYLFRRDAYRHIGGAREPVLLGVRFYEEGTTAPSINSDNFNYSGFEDIRFDTVADNIQRGRRGNRYPHSEPYNIEGVLVYTAPDSNLSVYMTYWDSYLLDEPALMLFQKIVSSVKVESTLDERVEIIKSDFYRANPDLKPGTTTELAPEM